MSSLVHPSEVLFAGKAPKALPACDHYCGTEVRMKKALALQAELGPCFDITFDCEDGAPIGQEREHAQLVTQLIQSDLNQFQRVGVRVHDPESDFFAEDVAILVKNCAAKLAYITIPKVSSAEQVQTLIDLINQQSEMHGHAHLIPIHVLIESHAALQNVFSIAAISQIECLSFGLMDFVSEHMGAIPASAMDQDQFKHPLVTRAMLEVSAASHRYAKTPSHNVCTEIKDQDRITSDCLIAKNHYGYTRKWSIHPNQVPIIVDAFSPQGDEVDEAINILKAAQNAQWGPIQWQGKLHDRASYRYFWTVLQRANNSPKQYPQLSSTNWFNEYA
jgi:citrate lyase subunit beta / citryl-CoA lyase